MQHKEVRKGRLRGHRQHFHSRAQGFNLNAGGQDFLTEVEIPSVRTGPGFTEVAESICLDAR
jgi:hypothetical protein